MDPLLEPLSRIRKQWTTLGEIDPFRAILSRPGESAMAWDRTAFFETGVVEIEEVLQTAKRFSPVHFAAAMDFGCGVGRLSQALALHFDRVIGIDIAESMIQTAAQFNEFPNRCEYVHNVASDLPALRDKSVDFIYSNITLQHMVPSLAGSYIREFFRIARHDAHVIFQLPCRPRSAAWHRIKNAVPVALSNLLWRVRTGNREAMESYFIPEERVRDLVGQAGGSVRFVESDQSGPLGWQSRKYFCTRNAAV
jgi:SAM-dependent methyltransferase